MFKVFLKYFTTFYNARLEYPNPKDYAKKFVSKANRKKCLAFIYTMINIKNSPAGQPLEPGKIKEKVAKMT